MIGVSSCLDIQVSMPYLKAFLRDEHVHAKNGIAAFVPAKLAPPCIILLGNFV